MVLIKSHKDHNRNRALIFNANMMFCDKLWTNLIEYFKRL